MGKQGKVWGDTEQIYGGDTVSAHAINIKKGGYCSIHKHIFKSNAFYVISGMLAIDIFRENGIKDSTILMPGDMTTVEPGEKHRFTALADTQAVEIYDVKFHGEDIVRDDNGGVNA
jgi:mannose-6-phosphate isomerase-like protein (cupin superfamily)